MPLKGGDPLTGPRVVLGAAAGTTGWRRGAILRGLLFLGDEPTVRLIYGCRRELDDDACGVLASSSPQLPTDAMARFYIGWLQEAVENRGERGVGTLASRLAAFASQAAGIVSLSRTFPGWAAADGQAVHVLETWTFPEYAEMAASTLDAIASGSRHRGLFRRSSGSGEINGFTESPLAKIGRMTCPVQLFFYR